MKYPYAIYLEDNKWEKVFPNQLNDTDFRAKLRGVYLFDKNKTYRLFIRFRKDCPHFYSRGKNRENFTSEKDTDEHNKTIQILIRFFRKKEYLRICHYAWTQVNKDNNEKPELIDIYKIKNYEWNTEVKQVISADGFVKSDIVGRSKTLELSDNNPQIIVEVVHTHFLTFESFNRYRLISEHIPLVVLIYFVQERGKYNNMKSSKRNEQLGFLRLSFYMLDGSFWVNDERFEEVYPNLEKCNLNNRKDYFNAVREFKIKDILNKKDVL